MKEIDLGGVTLIEYENDRIYENARMIKYLCILSFVMALITASIYIIIHTLRNTWSLDFEIYLLFFFYLLLPPFALALQYSKEEIRPSEYSAAQLDNLRRKLKPSKKKITHFPFASTICKFLSFEIMKVIMLFVVGLMGIFTDFVAYMGIWANHIGQMGLSTIVIYIALVYLIKNCILMKKEWEANPPQVVQEALKEKQDEQNAIIEQKNNEQYQELITKCGIKFFIKYYKQIKRLPLRDVEIHEDYSAVEREERLVAAKSIIDLNLTELALDNIINSYGEILEQSYIEQAKALLSECHGKVEQKTESKIDIQESESFTTTISAPRNCEQKKEPETDKPESEKNSTTISAPYSDSWDD